MPMLKAQGVKTIVLLLHEGGFQNAAPRSGSTTVNGCENFAGPSSLDIVSGLDPRDRRGHLRAHARAVHLHDQRPAGHQCVIVGRLVTDIDLTIDRRIGDDVSATAEERHRHADRREGPGATALLAHYKHARRTAGEPGRRHDHRPTCHSTRHRPGQIADGESAIGDVIANAQLEATQAGDFGGAQIALMNPGGIRADCAIDQSPAARRPAR